MSSVDTFPLTFDVPELSDDQRSILASLTRRLYSSQQYLNQHDRYYNGENIIRSLGISIPPELEGLYTVVGWPRLAVDVLDERLDVVGFRYPDSDDADEGLQEIWQLNNLDQEHQLAHLDAFVFGRGFVVVGSSDDGPLITVESPKQMAVEWDARARKIKYALQAYEMDGQTCAALYLPGETIYMTQDRRGGQWEVTDRDQHGMEFPPVVQIANRQRTHNRYGVSEITPEVRSVTDACVRTMMGLEVAREFYSTPQRYVLGISEEAFQRSDGTMQTAWEAYMSKMLVAEFNEDGGVPTVGQFAAYDPSVYTKIIDMYAQTMGSLIAVPAEFLGRTTENPSSADAIRMSTDRLIRRAKRKQRSFEGGWEEVMRLALAVAGGEVPEDAKRITTMWSDPNIPTPLTTAQSVAQLVSAGVYPRESSVVLDMLDLDPAQQSRMATDRQKQEAKDERQRQLDIAQQEAARAKQSGAGASGRASGANAAGSTGAKANASGA